MESKRNHEVFPHDEFMYIFYNYSVTSKNSIGDAAKKYLFRFILVLIVLQYYKKSEINHAHMISEMPCSKNKYQAKMYRRR